MARKRTTIVRVGVDLAKSVMQVHAVDSEGGVVAARQLPRSEFLDWCSKLPRGCIVAMEACCGAHHWSRELTNAGLTPKLIAPTFVTPYRIQGKTGKNDANDAAAICEAAGRPHMRFIPTKTAAQQGVLSLHALREGYIRDRNACMNRSRGLLAEFGIVFPVSTLRFRKDFDDLVSEFEHRLPPTALDVLKRCAEHFQQLDRHVDWCDEMIRAHAATDPRAILAMTVSGVGALSASALVAAIGDGGQFKNGRQLSAWLGLVPRISSSGGVPRLGRITRRGDQYLRKLMIIGARSSLRTAASREDEISKWAQRLKERKGFSKAAVALANKNARTVWRLLSNSG